MHTFCIFAFCINIDCIRKENQSGLAIVLYKYIFILYVIMDLYNLKGENMKIIVLFLLVFAAVSYSADRVVLFEYLTQTG